MREEIIIAGSGGQGIMFLGNLIAQCALTAGKHTTSYPSYGAEMRGGTASCSVIISDEEIGSPVIISPSILVVMNEQSYKKFSPKLKKGGRLFINSSLVESRPENGILVPATETAVAEGDIRAANLVMFGKLVSTAKICGADIAEETIINVFSSKKKLLDVNLKSFVKGTSL